MTKFASDGSKGLSRRLIFMVFVCIHLKKHGVDANQMASECRLALQTKQLNNRIHKQ